MTDKTKMLNSQLRYLLLDKYKLSNTEIRILWEESDSFVSTFVKGNSKYISAGKFFSLVSNSKIKGLKDLHEDLMSLIDRLTS